MRRTQKMRKKRKKRIIIGFLVVFLAALGVVGGYAFHLYQEANKIVSESHEEIERENEISQLREEKVDPIEDNVSVLFIGVDNSEHRAEENARSDALILATFNKNDTSIKLLSIPRDSYVYIPEVGYSTKINHAHSYAGPRATVETVEEFLQVPVDYYVRMNFDAFVDVVDALDGIWFDVPFEMVEPDSNDNRDAIHLYPGYQKLNGEEALALARSRKYDSDIQRGQRQQQILKAIADKAASASSILKLEDVMKAVGANMKTNLKMEEIRGFLSYGMSNDVDMETINLEGVGDYLSDGGWYFLVDEESKLDIQRELQRHLELDPRRTEEESHDEEAWEQPGLSS